MGIKPMINVLKQVAADHEGLSRELEVWIPNRDLWKKWRMAISQQYRPPQK